MAMTVRPRKEAQVVYEQRVVGDHDHDSGHVVPGQRDSVRLAGRPWRAYLEVGHARPTRGPRALFLQRSGRGGFSLCLSIP
jgi:hypothetical protein